MQKQYRTILFVRPVSQSSFFLAQVGDNQVLLQSIKGSAYYNSFGDRAAVWETKLSDLDEVLNSLNSAQRKWVYLEPYQEQMKFKESSNTGVSTILKIRNAAAQRSIAKL